MWGIFKLPQSELKEKKDQKTDELNLNYVSLGQFYNSTYKLSYMHSSHITDYYNLLYTYLTCLDFS